MTEKKTSLDDSRQSSVTVEELAEHYLQRLRDGERPRISEYSERHPEIADEIQDVFHTLAMLEDFALDHHDDVVPDLAADAPVQLGEYRILRELGRGGMGVVFEAEHTTMRRRVALKVLHKRAAARDHDLQRFLREARAAGRLHHTNIVPVFEVGVEDDRHYYAMQCIQGQNLDLVIDDLKRMQVGTSLILATDNSRNGDSQSLSAARCLLSGAFEKPAIVTAESDHVEAIDDETAEQAVANTTSTGIVVPESSEMSNVGHERESYFHRVVRVGLQVAEAVAHAHDHGILHRDIKPSNLLLDTAGTVWVTDFGLARSEGDDLTHTGDIVGTLRYMAPERFQGQADARSDIYSIGLTLYELCTLRHAFDRRERAELIRQVTRHDPPQPSKVNPLIPRDLETIVLKCIARDPGDRYATAHGLATDLRLFLDDRPVRARRATVIEQTWRWCRRNPALAMMLGCIGGLLLILSFGALKFAYTQKQHAVELSKENLRAKSAESQARIANLEANRALYESYVAQARASRWSGQRGRRFQTLKALKSAREILPTLEYEKSRVDRSIFELRNEAIAAMPLVDVHPKQQWRIEKGVDRGTAFSPDGTMVGWWTDDAICVNRLNEDDTICSLESGGRVEGLRFGPHSKQICALIRPESGPKFARVWDLESHQSTARIPAAWPPEFDPDGQHIAVINKNSVHVFEIATAKKPISSLDFEISPRLIRYSPNGDLGIVCEKTVFIYAGDQLVEQTEFPAEIQSFDIGTKGNIAVGGRNHFVYVRNTTDGAISSIKGHTGNVVQTHFSRDGRRLATEAWGGSRFIHDAWTNERLLSLAGFHIGRGGFSQNEKAIGLIAPFLSRGVFEFANGAPFRMIRSKPKQHYWHAVAHPKIPSIVALSGGDVELWDIESESLLLTIPAGGAGDVCFSPDGQQLYLSGSGGRLCRTCDVTIQFDDKTQKWTCQASPFVPVNGLDVRQPKTIMQHIELSEDGTRLLTLDGRKRVVLFDLETQQILATMGPHTAATRIALSPNARFAVTTTWHGKGVRVWNCETGELVRDLAPNEHAGHSKFSPDGRWLIVCTRQRSTIWDTATWTPRVVEESLDGREKAVAFSPDSRLAIIPHTEFAWAIVDVKSAQVVAVLEAPIRRSGRPMFNPAGDKLLLAAPGGMQIWNLQQLRQQLGELGLSWE